MTKKFDLNKTIENALSLKPPSRVKLIDFNKVMPIACVPYAATSVAPDDQSPCIIEKCQSCNQDIWVSEKKRNHRDTHPNVEIYCFPCLIISATIQGLPKPELVDVASLN